MQNLNEILSHLPLERISDLETITQTIIDTEKAEIIVLFGSYARGDYKTDRGIVQGKKSDYDILVVTEDSEKRKGLRSKLRGKFRDTGIPVQLIVEKIGFVNSNLEEKQYFFWDIKQEGIELYNSGKCQLADEKELTPKRRREIAEEDFENWYEQAVNFYDHYLFDIKKNRLRFASFQLQQCVEMCYTAIEMVFSHYNPHEHNLYVLRDRTLKFDSRIKTVLSYDTELEKELFDQLNFAYIGGRYKSDAEFPVTKEQLDYWSDKAQQFMKLVKVICLDRIIRFRGLE